MKVSASALAASRDPSALGLGSLLNMESMGRMTHFMLMPIAQDYAMPVNNVVYNIEVEEGKRTYRAAYYLENDLLHVMAPEVTQIMALGGLPPEIGAKLVVQYWIYQGRIAPLDQQSQRAA
jgi:hypothetical protein